MFDLDDGNGYQPLLWNGQHIIYNLIPDDTLTLDGLGLQLDGLYLTLS